MNRRYEQNVVIENRHTGERAMIRKVVAQLVHLNVQEPTSIPREWCMEEIAQHWKWLYKADSEVCDFLGWLDVHEDQLVCGDVLDTLNEHPYWFVVEMAKGNFIHKHRDALIRLATVCRDKDKPFAP